MFRAVDQNFGFSRSSLVTLNALRVRSNLHDSAHKRREQEIFDLFQTPFDQGMGRGDIISGAMFRSVAQQ